MADFVKLETDYGTRYINADHIVMVEGTHTSYDMESIITLDIMFPDAHGTPKPMQMMCEDKAERVIEKIMGD